MKKKYIIVLVAFIVLVSYALYKVHNFGVKGYFYNVYVMTQEKKIKKEIERKIYSKEFNEIISKIELNGLSTVNYLTDRDSLRIALNDSNSIENMKKINKPDITANEAEAILVVSRELTELQKVSGELKGYLKKRFKDFDYEYIANIGDKTISFIREKEKIYSLLPDDITNVIKVSSLGKAEQVQKILNGVEIPKEIAYSTKDFFEDKLDISNMESLYVISKSLLELQGLIPELKQIHQKLYPNLDYEAIAKDGKLYIDDKKADVLIEKEYSEGKYTYENPYVKVNPYNRVSNSVLIKYPGVEKENVTVTVNGRANGKNLQYKVIKDKDIKVFGLYIGGEANIVTINNGIKEIKIPVTIGELPDNMPSVVIMKSKGDNSAKNMIYTTYVSNLNSYGLVFDKDGNIRYIFDPNLNNDNSGRYLKFHKDAFIYYTRDNVILFSKIGKVISRLSMEEFNKKNDALPFLDTGYPEFTSKNILERNSIVNTKGFTNINYPLGQIVETNSDTGEIIFSANVYFDYNDKTKNSINSSEEVEFPN